MKTLQSPFDVNRQWLLTVFLPIFVVVFPVAVDLINGYLLLSGRASSLTIGVLFRGVIILIGLYSLLKTKNKVSRIYIVGLIGVFLVDNFVWAIFSKNYNVLFEINKFSKILFIFLIISILTFVNQGSSLSKDFIFRLVAWVGFFTSLSILLSFELGFGYKTYGDYSYGIKGFFNAQNDTGLTLLISLISSFAVFLKTQKIQYLIFCLTIILASLIIGTRAGLFGPFLIIFSFVFAAIVNYKAIFPKKLSNITLAIFAILICLLIIGGVSVVKNYEKFDYMIYKIQKLSNQTPRSRTQLAAITQINNRNLGFDIFGEGSLQFRHGISDLTGRRCFNKEDKAIGCPVENDFFDVFGNYGLLLFSIIYLWYLFIMIFSAVHSIFHFCLDSFVIFLSIFIFLGHSSLAGHAIVSPQVGNVMGPIIFLAWRNFDLGKVFNFSKQRWEAI